MSRPADGTATPLEAVLGRVDRAFSDLDDALSHARARPTIREIGHVVQVGRGVARVAGLPDVRAEELVRFPGRRLGMAFNLDPDEIGALLLDPGEGIGAGDEVRRTGRVMDVPVGEALLGRVVDAAGRPRDGKPSIRTPDRLPVERVAPPMTDRAPVRVPLQTGLKVVDALLPIGRGQRELILGDRRTGKTAIAVDTVINQRGRDVVCFYCAIAERTSSMANVVENLREHGAMDYTVVVVTTGGDPAGLQFVTPYAATSMAEHFVREGRDVLIVYDDLTRHARAYRELSLLLRRPPGREAYPGDIFYVHSRLLERATRLSAEAGGGSLTALPIAETQAENIAAYIPTNLISITDGQIYLTPRLSRHAVLPAVDVGRSVSRVGGRAQLPAFRAVAGDLRLSYSQFEELERFTRYGARLEEDRQRELDRGVRVREVLQQDRYGPVPVGEQVAVLLAVVDGVLDGVAPERVRDAEAVIRRSVVRRAPDELDRVTSGDPLSATDRSTLRGIADRAVREAGLAAKAGSTPSLSGRSR